MEIATIISIIAVCLTAIAFLVTQGRRGGQMEADIKNIMSIISRIEKKQDEFERRFERQQDATDKKISVIDKKVDEADKNATKALESAKSAHHRIDEIKTAGKTAKEKNYE
ncbi:MAG: hypothetical protein LBQ27_03235 [Clostridiales bacterium]|jgi:hypothetical protein|nr:hypothetical protein [Clostridiales bacterium]